MTDCLDAGPQGVMVDFDGWVGELSVRFTIDDSSPASCMQLLLTRAVGLGRNLPPLHCEQGGAVCLNT